MSHQYPTTPTYGAQYPPTPYYPQFPHTGQQGATGIPGFHQLNGQSPSGQSPATISNTARYDINANVHHQPAPLPFAPHFNPELLKHFPAPPPPPLPLGFPHFPPSVNTPPVPLLHQNYPAFPPLPLSASNRFIGQASESTLDQRSYGHQIPGLQDGSHAIQNYSQVLEDQPAANIRQVGISTDRPLSSVGNINSTHTDAAPSNNKDGNAHKTLNGSFASSSQQSNPVQMALELHRVQPSNSEANEGELSAPVPDTQTELKERAKAALLSLVPHNIRYENLLAEGVNSDVLQRLYEELGLNWRNVPAQLNDKSHIGKIRSLDASEKNVEVTSSVEQTGGVPHKLPADVTTRNTAPKLASTILAVSQASPNLNQNMERKDRIAQLLAAKAGKSSVPSLPSKSQSPASVAELTPAEVSSPPTGTTTQSVRSTRNLAPAELVKQKMEQLKKETIAKVRAERAKTAHASAISTESDFPTSVAISQREVPLPTPVREHLVQNGFASLIPGLFLTSAEVEEAELSARSAQQQVPDNILASLHDENNELYTSHPSISESIAHPINASRKRSAAENISDEEEDFRGKRQAIEPSESPDDSMDMAEDTGAEYNDDASEGEIIEDEQYSYEAHQTVPEQLSDVNTLPLARSHNTNNQLETRAINGSNVEVEQHREADRSRDHMQNAVESTLPKFTATTTGSAVLSPPLSKLPDPMTLNLKLEGRPGQSPRPLLKATPEQIAERAAQLKADFLRQRAIRQKQLQDGIPVLNTEVAKTQTKLKDVRGKLAQVQADLQSYETSIRRARETESELVREIEQLETQISNGVSGQKLFTNELSHLKQETTKEATAQTETTPLNAERTVSQTPNSVTQAARSTLVSDHDQGLVQDYQREPASSDTHQEISPNIQEESSPKLKHIPTLEPESILDVQQPPQVGYSHPSTNSPESFVDTTQDILPSATPSPEEDNEILVEDSDEVMQESDRESDDSHMSIDEVSDGSVSMSDSGSDEYEPAEPEAAETFDDRMESDEYEPEVEPEVLSDDLLDDNVDTYEPIEDLDSTDASDNVTTPIIATQVSAEGATTNTTNDLQLTRDEAPLGDSQIENVIKQLPTDDQESGLQLSEAQTLTKPEIVDPHDIADGSDVLGAAEPLVVRYVPYQSPLGALKSYRFHPFFTEQIKDGYRSLTYSHKIDSTLPLCQTELTGLVCTDPQCQDQHFSSMALTDDKILVQMSSASDIKDKNLRDQYLIGLKQVIARLRQEGVKEFSAVADALSQYRRDWTAAQTSI